MIKTANILSQLLSNFPVKAHVLKNAVLIGDRILGARSLQDIFGEYMVTTH